MITTLACIATCATLASLHAQTPRVLGNPDAELATPLTRIASIRELHNGRVLVVDEREGLLRLVDFRNGTLTQVGRTGAGPREYGFAGRLVALPGDTTLLHDPRNARFLIINPDGTPGELFRLADPVASALGARGSIPRASDARGSLYFEASPVSRGLANAPTALDSVPLRRYERRAAKLDTVTWLQLPTRNVQIRPGQDAGGVSISVGVQAFPARDDWAVLADGSVAVVRVRDYHVDWILPNGRRSATPPVRFDPVPVTETEKRAFRADRMSRATPRSAGSLPVALPEPEWPAAMPPFEYWQTFSRSNGEVWVLRSHKASERPVYDVFTSTGGLIARVTTPTNTRIAGFGNGTLYLVRRDQDDLEYLQRYRLSER